MSIFDQFFNNIDSTTVCGLTDELKALYISNYFDHHEQSVLLTCNSLFEANKFYQMLKNYQEEVYFFPMDDFMTSEVLAISPDFKIIRLETMNVLKNLKKAIVVTNLMGFLRFLPSPSLFYNNYIMIKKDQDISRDDLLEKLTNIGYTRETMVNKTGELAVRGFVIDIFPIHEENPIRIEFWGDTIDSIRYFNIDTQLTIRDIQTVEIMPNTEFITSKSLEEDHLHRDLIQYEQVVSIYDYLSNNILFLNNEHDLSISYKNLLDEINEYCIDSNIPLNTRFMLDFNDLLQDSTINLCNFDDNNLKEAAIYESYPLHEQFKNLTEIPKILEAYRKKYEYVVICVSNRYQANKIIDTFEEENYIFTDKRSLIPKKINIIIQNIK